MSEQLHSQGSICWYECGTRDTAAAKAFYTQLGGAVLSAITMAQA